MDYKDASKIKLAITGANAVTPLGRSVQETAAALKDGVTRLHYSESLADANGNPLKISYIQGFELDDENSSKAFMTRSGQKCLADLMEQSFKESGPPESIYLLTGQPSGQRPGTRIDPSAFIRVIEERGGKAVSETFDIGSPSAIYAMEKAFAIISNEPDALCIIGGVDCLLDPESLEWFEADQRLNSEGSGRSHSFCPSQAAAFFLVESSKKAAEKGRNVFAEVIGIHTAKEPASFASGLPSKAEGLTEAITGALGHEAVRPESVTDIFCDLNGEFYRSKQWGLAEIRCFDSGKAGYNLWHPADCMGSPGAATAAVLIATAAEGIKNKWLKDQVLVFGSSDHGHCGAVVVSASLTV